ncbi:acyltransferase family protein [Ideonella sp. DXS22W]|uniref:Acyltransferase family protein n=1 Tax=Pseudaquabacterium inlustre TaxID=2984192 RepID=A0ABU9CH86_9BURK
MAIVLETSRAVLATCRVSAPSRRKPPALRADHHPQMSFRTDINGLRALAVLAVIANHASPAALPGGYLGVDVFFVISGYLITRNQLSDMAAGDFSVRRFFARRAGRILPALFVICLTSTPFAWWLMDPFALQNFSESVLGVVLLIPNLFFWRHTSYFDTKAHFAPLIHTWSLGVEEQFYLLAPLGFLAIARSRFRSTLLVAAALASLALAEYFWRIGKSEAGFYLPLTRAWEFIVGSMVAFGRSAASVAATPLQVRLRFLSNVGWVGLVASLFALDQNIPVPSLFTLLPVASTAMIIIADEPSVIASRVLGWTPLSFIGTISYSLYLWHQPVLAFARLWSGSAQMLGVLDTFGALLLVLLLATLTWRFVEQPCRSSRKVSGKGFLLVTAASASILISIGAAGVLSKGYRARFNAEQLGLIDQFDKQQNGRYVQRDGNALSEKAFNRDNKPKVLIIGDSYAHDFVNATVEAGISRQIDLSFLYISGACQTYPHVDETEKFVAERARPMCTAMRSRLMTSPQVSQSDLVVVANYWLDWSTAKMAVTQKFLLDKGAKRVIFVGMKRTTSPDPVMLARLPVSARMDHHVPEWPEVGARNSELAAAIGSENVSRINDLYCREGQCRLFTVGGMPISIDGMHLTQAGARAIGHRLWAAPPLSTWARQFDVVTDDHGKSAPP